MHRKNKILHYLGNNHGKSSGNILNEAGLDISISSLKRDLSELLKENLIEAEGKGKSLRYFISPGYRLLFAIDPNVYFQEEIDNREIIGYYNFELLDLLKNISIFTDVELEKLNGLQAEFKRNISQLSDELYKKDMERLAIDLSWKSSQIEGNTYSLLETERLLKEKKTASGKSKDEAVMLLNHKDAVDFIIENPKYFEQLTVAKIENIHAILIKELDVDKNVRTRRVGITGTNYKPLDNEFQIKEALEGTCKLVNGRRNTFEKALLLFLMVSYIQPFNDGNKRTARITGNAQLIASGYCPISFRTVDSIDYKKAMLIFYEQNNLSAFKKIFIEQFEFSVMNYF